MYFHKAQKNIFQQSVEQIPKRNWRTWLIGRPLPTADAPHQTIGKLVGLAIFSSDALSSVGYGPQELMVVLVAAGMSAISYALPIAIAIVILLAILTFSYEQTIHAYPGGGGAYIVSRDNFGEAPAQVAGASLLTDYILTVAVSVSSGVAQITSAFPGLDRFKVEIAVVMILLIMVINLRGVRESGAAFAIPTYFFLISMYLTVLLGLFHFFTGTLGVVPNPPTPGISITQSLTIFLILRAFANGTTSLTGVEAISNGVTAFKEPRSKNAGITLIWMSGILASLLLGITFLAIHIHAVPSESETVISQLARTILNGRNLFYLATITGTTIVLIMAANTAFAGFPRLSAMAAGDGFLPRQLTYRGSRLVYSTGIVALALIACGLVIFFRASVTGLIPLYAIGVFLSFSLSQAGMARRWHKCGRLAPGVEIQEPGSVLRFDPGWHYKMIINGIGAVCTFIVMIIFAVFKFVEGAWIILLLIPLLVAGFFAIHHHYRGLARQLSLESGATPTRFTHNRVIMPIASVHKGTLRALRYARSLSDDVTAVHISIDTENAAKVESKWEIWGDDVRLIILDSPYRMFMEPLLDYIAMMDAMRKPGEMITIVVPQFVPKHWWTTFLHTRTAESLRKVLLHQESIVITEVPYQVK